MINLKGEEALVVYAMMYSIMIAVVTASFSHGSEKSFGFTQLTAAFLSQIKDVQETEKIEKILSFALQDGSLCELHCIRETRAGVTSLNCIAYNRKDLETFYEPMTPEEFKFAESMAGVFHSNLKKIQESEEKRSAQAGATQQKTEAKRSRSWWGWGNKTKN